MRVKRGEIYYIEKSPSFAASGSEIYAGRPAVVVSNDANNDNSSVIEVVYLTTQPKRDLPTHVVIRSSKKNSIALCEQVTSVCEDRIGDYIGTCTDLEMQQIDIALAISLGIDTERSSSAETHDATSNEAIIKLETERNVYKQLYERMLERTVIT